MSTASVRPGDLVILFAPHSAVSLSCEGTNHPYGLTICVSVALEPLLAASPPYAAPIVCVPAVRLLTVQRAVLVVDLPFLASATAAHLLIVLVPSVNATVPVGALPVTLAVKATRAPTVDGLSELARVVVLVVLLPIACDSGGLAEPALAASPL